MALVSPRHLERNLPLDNQQLQPADLASLRHSARSLLLVNQQVQPAVSVSLRHLGRILLLASLPLRHRGPHSVNHLYQDERPHLANHPYRAKDLPLVSRLHPGMLVHLDSLLRRAKQVASGRQVASGSRCPPSLPLVRLQISAAK